METKQFRHGGACSEPKVSPTIVQWACMCVCLFMWDLEPACEVTYFQKQSLHSCFCSNCECLPGQLTMLCECGEHHSHTVFSEMWAKECCVSQWKAETLLLQCWNSVAASAMHSRLSGKNGCCFIFYTCAYSGMPQNTLYFTSTVEIKQEPNCLSSILASFPGSPPPTPEWICIHGKSLVSFLTWAWRYQNKTQVFRTERQPFAGFV